MALTAEQTEIIKSTAPMIQERGGTISHTFYDILLRNAPELNNVFNQTNQITGRQAAALAGAMYAYAAHITDLEAFSPAVEHICQKHASLHVQPAQYGVFGTYLLAAMKQVLGDTLTPGILDAWQAAYKQLADLMIVRESQLYSLSEDWVDWRDFRIQEKIAESSEITSYYLVPVNGKPLPLYIPGQYVSVRTKVPSDTLFHIRQFSLSEAPNCDRYRITVRRDADPAYPGSMATVLHNQTNTGDVVQLSHPRGDFFMDTESLNPSPKSPIVLISAGVGQTPNLSIIETLTREDPARRISWVHVARSSKTHAFGPCIKAIARMHSNMQTHVFVKCPTPEDAKSGEFDFLERMDLGRLDPDRDLFVADRTTVYYICGPECFMTDMADSLKGMGVTGDVLVSSEVASSACLISFLAAFSLSTNRRDDECKTETLNFCASRRHDVLSIGDMFC